MTSKPASIAVRNVRLFDGKQLVPGSTVVIAERRDRRPVRPVRR